MNTFLTNLSYVDDHPEWPLNTVVTHDGEVGIIREVLVDGETNVHLALEGREFNTSEVVPANEVNKGGTLLPYDPTMNSEMVKDMKQSYKTVNLKEPQGLIPAGWAVIYEPDDVYVGWGLSSQKVADALAVGHKLGISHLASKM